MKYHNFLYYKVKRVTMLKTQSKKQIWLIHVINSFSIFNFFFLSLFHFLFLVEMLNMLTHKNSSVYLIFWRNWSKIGDLHIWTFILYDYQFSWIFFPVLSLPIPRFKLFYFFKRFLKNKIECTKYWQVFQNIWNI